MAELKKDETKRMLGRQRHACRICGAEGEFEAYLAREMMQGTREEFVYFACGSCKCLQIAQVPENLGDYYGDGYYSMQLDEIPDASFDVPVSNMSKVLDVGCGAGAWLLQKAASGWGNLHGCDPFLARDRHYGDRMHIRSCSIHEMEGEGTFDIIQMSDSFEHMADPLEALKSVRRLLKGSGILYMTIPTWPNVAFDEYGPHWYQLDAPRHLFLHSKESLDYLAKAAGLTVFDRKYNSNSGQFVRSWFYLHGIPYWEQQPFTAECFTRKELERLEWESAIANERECGDHMEAYLRRGALPSANGGGKVIYQRFRREDGRHAYPYPPIYREPDTDYLCFTTDERIRSDHWKMQRVENLDAEMLEPYLATYENRFEVLQNQIQMDSVFGGDPAGNIVTVPALEDLPMVKLDLEKFEPTADENGNYIWKANPVYQKGKYNGRPLLLTIGVPVSNQIGTIDRCLSHIKPLLDRLDAELIAVDTGSTDGTIEICRKYGARVYEHPWHDNMSAARNEAIRHARGLWYMSIDDDEWFEDVEDILRFFKSGEYKRYTYASYIQRNYIDSEGTAHSDFHTPRMALITPELHFEGRIHDALSVAGPGCRPLSSYAHHYGFVDDQPDKRSAKFQRNTAILMHDVYEYPECIRYLFQLANEYKGVKNANIALKLFSACASLSIKQEGDYRCREAIVGIGGCLYDMNDDRLFPWLEYMVREYPLITAERCQCEFMMEDLAFVKRRPAKEVLTHFNRYEMLLEEFKNDKDPGKKATFFSLPIVENDYYIMDAIAVGFCACLNLGEDGRALQLLNQFSLEAVKIKRISVLEEGFSASYAIFEAFCKKPAPLQWEEWADEILNAFAAGMTRYAVERQQKERFPEILSRISVAAVQRWLASSEFAKRERVREKLTEFALESAESGRLVDGSTPLSELALCAVLLKEAYVKNRMPEIENPADAAEAESGERDRILRILKAYILAEGAFAERYYSPGLLEDAAGMALPPETRALYRMASALSDGTASRESVSLLKQALEIYPPFHQEVRCILKELR